MIPDLLPAARRWHRWLTLLPAFMFFAAGCFGGPSHPSQPRVPRGMLLGGGHSHCTSPDTPAPLSDDTEVRYSLLGRQGHAWMQSACDGASAGCSAKAPLAVGARHRFYVETADDYEPKWTGTSGLTLVSSSPDVLALEGAEPGESPYRATNPADGGCQQYASYYVTATMVPKKPGVATLTLQHGDEVVDRYEIHVASAKRVGIRSLNAPHPDQTLRQVVMYYENTWTIFAEAFSASGAPLVLSDEAVHWTTSDKNILSLAPSHDTTSMLAEITGSEVDMISDTRLGTARITAKVGDAESTLDVRVIISQ